MQQEYDLSVRPLNKTSAFEEAIRHSNKLNPLTPAFSQDKLISAFNRLQSPSIRDMAIRDFAIWVDFSIKSLLSRLRQSSLMSLPADSRLTSLINFSSQEFNRVLSDPELFRKQRSDSKKPHRLRHDLLTMRSGLVITAQEFLENTIDAISPAIRDSLLEIERGKGIEYGLHKPPDTEVRDYLDCAIIYRTLLEFWQKVFYGGYDVQASPDGWQIGRDRAHAIREAVGQERRMIQDENHLRNMMRRGEEELQTERSKTNIRFPAWVPDSFVAQPDGITVQLRQRDGRDLDYDKLETARVISAHHTWIAKLSQLTLHGVAGLTGRLVLEGWLLFRRIVYTYNNINNYNPNIILVECPTLKRDSLLSTLSSALQVEPDLANYILELLSHRGESDRDLWSHPSLSLARNRVSLYTPALIFADLERVFNQLLKLNLPNKRYGEVKGHGYEQHVRDMVSDAIANTTPLPDWRVDGTSVKFEDREFDLVINLDQILLIGEVKCSAHPADPYEVADRERLIDKAAEQGAAQVAWLRSNWERFRKRSTLGLSSRVDDYIIIHVVIVDGSYGSGFPINDTPVLDSTEILSFILSDTTAIAQHQVSRIPIFPIKLYASSVEAARVLPIFLRNPPLIDFYSQCCTERELLYVADGFFPGKIRYRDVGPVST